MYPSVSIIVPVYNVEKHIEKCLVSLFEQNYENIEYIIVDDCSLDHSISVARYIMKNYTNRDIEIITHNMNKGLAGARATGLKAATGDYIIHIDGDDYCEKNLISLLIEKVVEEQADIVVCDFFLSYHKKEIKRTDSPPCPSNGKICSKAILEGRLSKSLMNKLIKRELYFNNNIKPKEGINMGEDLYLTSRLFYYAQKVSYVNLPLAHYVQYNSESYTANISEKSKQNLIDLESLLTKFFSTKPDAVFFDNSLHFMRIGIKYILLCNTKNDKEYHNYIDLYRESDLYYKKFDGFGIHNKLVYYLFINNKTKIARLFLLFLNFTKSVFAINK